MTERLRFAWWNTSLSPSVALNRSVGDERNFVSSVLIDLMEVEGVDFVGMTEISHEDFEFIKTNFDEKKYGFIGSFSQVSGKLFSMAFVYRLNNISINGDVVDVISGPKGDRFKVAKKIIITFSGMEDIYIFASHWPSQLYHSRNDEKYSRLALSLRQSVDSILEVDGDAKILLMGDYNCEPHDLSLSEGLFAARHRDRVLKKTSLLYNPFWKVLGPFYKLDSEYTHGTYYYNGGKRDRWLTFDQFFVSSGLLQPGNLGLMDAMTGVYSTKSLLDIIVSSKNDFDHLPVIASFERN